MKIDKSFDHHVHIGQFYEDYFSPHKVIETLSNNGIKGCWFSSTTACVSWSNGSEKLYLKNHIMDEINEALESALKHEFDARALYWMNLEEYLQVMDSEEMSIKDYFKEEISRMDYFGIKVHTRLNYWDTNDEKVIKIFDIMCDYVNKGNMPILIHCGLDECDRPDRFVNWFDKYKSVKFVLAHMRPVDTIIEMMRKYENVWTDTAFASNKSIERVFESGLGDRVLYGTDYPINRKVYK